MATITIAGREHVDLQAWAEANKFQLARKDEEIRLTNRTAQLAFKLKSQRAEINGVMLFLSHPVVLHQNNIWISQKDMKLAVGPILFPPKNRPGQALKIVALSAGHGGKDPGYQVSRQQEKKYTLLLTQELQKLAARAGFKTVMIRNADRFIEREERINQAKRAKADIYIELHYNSAGPANTESRGVETYCLTPDGANSTNGGADEYGTLPGNRLDENNMLLAYKIHRSLVEDLGMADRGLRRARFEVLREAVMPAVLVEAGFMSNPDELRKIQDPTHRRQTAQSILDGLLAYRRTVER
ncbi:MAG: N-acetylmuramoyl-L-alanine amidase [Verrucomicrobiota bacterium]